MFFYAKIRFSIRGRPGKVRKMSFLRFPQTNKSKQNTETNQKNEGVSEHRLFEEIISNSEALHTNF